MLKVQEYLSGHSLEALGEVCEECSGRFGIVCQHEVDHQRGILISDMGKA